MTIDETVKLDPPMTPGERVKAARSILRRQLIARDIENGIQFSVTVMRPALDVLLEHYDAQQPVVQAAEAIEAETRNTDLPPSLGVMAALYKGMDHYRSTRTPGDSR